MFPFTAKRTEKYQKYIHLILVIIGNCMCESTLLRTTFVQKANIVVSQGRKYSIVFKYMHSS